VHNPLSSSLLSKNLKIKIHRTIILPVVLYGCENWSLTLGKERKLRVYENRVLRIFGPKRNEVTRECRKIRNEELKDLYSSPIIFLVRKSRLITVFVRVICALLFSILAAEKSGCVKYADFFLEVLIWVLF